MKRVEAPKSKSYEHRFLICDFLSRLSAKKNLEKSPDNIDGSEVHEFKSKGSGKFSDDICATMRCISAIEMAVEDEKYVPLLDCGQSGSTLRFLLPVICALGIDASFFMRAKLTERPMDPLIEELISHACEIKRHENKICCNGRLKPGTFHIPGDISSQFVSGLLMALPLLDGDSEIIVKRPLASAAYVDMTLDCLRSFSIYIDEEHSESEQRYKVKGGQEYIIPQDYTIEGDWSNAAFWLVSGVLGDEPIAVEGLNPNSLQGDKALLELLGYMGAEIKLRYDGDEVIFESYPIGAGELKPLEIDAENIPDLVPLIALLCCFAKGKSRISGIKRLRLKESDRVFATQILLSGIGGKAEIREDEIEIYGLERDCESSRESGVFEDIIKLKGGEVNCFDDHRMVMTAAIASLRCSDKLVINNAAAVNKSYRGFFDEFERLGLSGNCVRK